MNLRFWTVIQAGIGVILGGGILYLLFKRINPLVVLADFAAIDRSRVIWAIIFIGLSYVFRAAFWQSLLPQSNQYKYGAAFRSTMVGYLANNILPARMGDPIQGLWLYLTQGGSIGSILGSLALQRILDIGAILVLLGIPVIYLNRVNSWAVQGAVVFGTLVVLFFVVAIGFKYLAHRDIAIVGKITRFVSRAVILKELRIWAADFGDSMLPRKPRTSLLWLLITWTATFYGLYFALDAIGLTQQVGFMQAALILSISALGLSIPSLPASLGTYQAAFISAGLLVGVSEDKALSASFLYQILWVGITSLLGLVSIGWERVGIKKMLEKFTTLEKSRQSDRKAA